MTGNKFIERRRPPRREDLTVDDLTDLVKYVYAGMAQRIAELQYTLAELAGSGKLDPQANMDLQFGCFHAWEFLYRNTTATVRREHDTNDEDWNLHDNMYSPALTVRHRVDIEPAETDDHWQFNEHLCGDGPIVEYPRNAVFHIEEPPFYATKHYDDD
jgi:hypothetical protein